jgi:hypothetical protein
MRPAHYFLAALSATRAPAMRLLLYLEPVLTVINMKSILINTV